MFVGHAVASVVMVAVLWRGEALLLAAVSESAAGLGTMPPQGDDKRGDTGHTNVKYPPPMPHPPAGAAPPHSAVVALTSVTSWHGSWHEMASTRDAGRC